MPFGGIEDRTRHPLEVAHWREWGHVGLRRVANAATWLALLGGSLLVWAAAILVAVALLAR